MKRENGDVEKSGLRNVESHNEIDENSVDLDKRNGDEEGVLTDNGGVDCAQIDRNGSLLGDNLDGPSLGGAERPNKWYSEFDMIFGNKKEQKGLDIDLVLPPYNRRRRLWEQDQYPYSREQDLSVKKVVDLASDDSDSSVEFLRDTAGCSSKDEQVESRMPDDGVGDSSYGLRPVSMAADYDQDLDLRFTIGVNNSGLDLEANSEKSNQSIEPPEDVEVIPRRPSNEIVMKDLSHLTASELFFRRRTARNLARTTLPDQNSGDHFSNQNQRPSTSNPLEQLGPMPGPFSDALKMVRERASKGAAQELIQWRHLVKNVEERINAAFVPSLLDLSLHALAISAGRIVSLGDIPNCLRGRLSNILCDIGGMNARFLHLLMEGRPTEIRIKNCSWLTEEEFLQTLGKCQTNELRVLQLDLCGKCMLDFGFSGVLNRCSSSFSRLAIISLRGACRLSDIGIRILVASAPLLKSINLGQCTLLTSNAIKFIADKLGSNLRELYIDECHKIDALQSLPALKKFKHLEVLSVAGIHSINDWFVSQIITAFGRSLRELDFADCSQLTDNSLKIIGKSCPDLCSFDISNLNQLTDLGMEYLANGCRSIQRLNLRHNEFSDEAVAAFLESSGESLLELILNNTKVGPLTALSLSERSRKLLSLDISWCHGISNEALGLIVDRCSSLKLLKIFGCSKITDVFLEGHSNQLMRIIGRNWTLILDHLDLFEPVQMLLQYSPLPEW